MLRTLDRVSEVLFDQFLPPRTPTPSTAFRKRMSLPKSVRRNIAQAFMHPRTLRPKMPKSRRMRNRILNIRAGGVIGMEIKSIDQPLETVMPFGITNDLFIKHVGNIAQGNDISQRIGRTTVYTRIYVSIIAQTTNVNNPGYYRWFLLYDRQPNGSLPNAQTILAGTVHDAMSFKEIDSRQRFKTLWDSGLVYLGDEKTSSATSVHPPHHWGTNVSIKCNLGTIYDGTGSGIGAISSGSLLICGIAGTPTLLNSANWSGRIRLRFHDGHTKSEWSGRRTLKDANAQS